MAAAVLYVGITLVIDSIQKIMNPEPIAFSPLLVAVLVVGIAGKFLLSLIYRQAQKVTGSEAFSAYGADSVSDVLSTAGVLAAVLAEKFTGYHIDGWMGILMAAAILYTGYSILKNAVNSLIGAPPDDAVYQEVEAFMLKIPGIYGVHDLIIHDYGPENQFLSAHVEMDSRMNLVDSHELAEQVMEKSRNASIFRRCFMWTRRPSAIPGSSSICMSWRPLFTGPICRWPIMISLWRKPRMMCICPSRCPLRENAGKVIRRSMMC